MNIKQEQSRIEYYRYGVAHRYEHKCGGYPFSRGEFLNQIPRSLSATNILEIGTAIGYSAYCFAHNNDVHVTTIDMNIDHLEVAQNMLTNYQVEHKIVIINGRSQELLPCLSSKFDIIFFDGFAPDPIEVKHFVRLLAKNGVIISSNLSKNSTTSNYLETLDRHELITIRDDDCAFSSFNSEVAKVCVVLYKDLEDLDDDNR